MPYVQANRFELYYQERGEKRGTPLLLLPGLGGNHRSWDLVAKWLRRDRRIIALDPRDAGRSQRAMAHYTAVDMAQDVTSFLDALGIEETDIAGFSMGGAIAQELAISNPARVRRLILIGTYDADDPRGTALFDQLARLRRLLSKEDYFRTLLPWIYTQREYERFIRADAVVKALVEDPLYQEPDAYDRQAQATVRFRSRERLAGIASPTLLIFGDEDLFTPLRFARSLEEGIARSRLAVLAGAGHGLLWTRGWEIAALVDAFLDSPAAPGSAGERDMG